ncbi:MAG: heme-binding domain-containing protein [Bacteroidetes bacterium]|nr:heme-binding domain-containing protein [Bacteroidota bacterium]
MKKAIINTFAILGLVFLTSMFFNHSTAQSSAKKSIEGKPISAGIMEIAEKSCVKCHSEGGKGIAMMHLNLSDWNNISMEKQAGKAKEMCKMVSKGMMPKKKIREKQADGVPSQEEVKTICHWAQSIQ